jgi:hypothetical protein
MSHLKNEAFMKRRKLCAICQRGTTDILCERCMGTWDINSKWVKDLVKQERYWRSVNSHERHLSPLHIGVDGELTHAHHHVSTAILYRQICQITRIQDENDYEDLELWAVMGGLSASEQHVLLCIMQGVNMRDGAAILNEVEHKHMTRSGYRRRMERLLHKLHDAVKTGEIAGIAENE